MLMAIMVALEVGAVPLGTPMTWTPAQARLGEGLVIRAPAAVQVLRMGTAQDPVDFGLEWPEPHTLGRFMVEFASLGGRVYEPSLDVQSLQVREDGAWRTVPAALAVDYSSVGRLAPVQGRGASHWTYRFGPVRATAIRVVARAPAHLDPGFQCIAVSSLEAEQPDLRPIEPGIAITGAPPEPPAWVDPGADLASPAADAQVRAGHPTTVRWPRPLMVNSVSAPPGGAVASIEYLAGKTWRPADALRPAGPGVVRFTPVATSGLRVRLRGRPGRVSVRLDAEGPAYFEAVRRSRSDILGERFRALPDGDLAASESLLLPSDFSKVAIGRPADEQETMVGWTGTFWMVEQSECIVPATGAKLPVQSVDRWFAPAAGVRKEPFGNRWMRLSSRYLDGWRPATVTRYDADGARFEQLLFVTAPPGAAGGVAPAPYGTIARVTVSNPTGRPLSTAFTYAMGRRRMYGGPGEAWHPFLLDPQPTGYRTDDGRTLRNAAGDVVFHSLQPGRWEGTPRENHFVVPVSLKPGETRTLWFFAPCVTAPVRDAAALSSLDPGRALADFRGYWDRFLDGAAALDLPEPRLNDLYRNLLAQCAIIALDGDVVRYGAYAYESYFGVEEGWPAVALAQYGLPDYAKRIADGMLSPEALDKANYHHQYRNGLAPWYALGIWRLTGDDAWLRRIAPTLRQCADWTIATTSANKDAKYGGLLPRHVYGGDVSMPAYSFYSNATCWRGLFDTAQAFEALGEPETARRYREAADTYHRRLMDLADRLVDRSSGLPFLPMAFDLGEGPTAREKEPAYPVLAGEVPASDTWAYVANYWNLFAPMLLEVRLFDQADPRAGWIPQYMEQCGGVLNGQARFSLGTDCIYGKGYIESLLQQGRRAEFLTSLYGLLAHGASRNLFSFPEVTGVFPLRTDNRTLYREYARERWSWLFRPMGGWIAGWQNQEGEPLSAGPGMALQLLRMALVREDTADDPPRGLRLLDGAPAHWFSPGKRVAFQRMRTHFGPVSLEVTRTASRVKARLEVRAAGGPATVVLRLPDPAGRAIRDVTVRGQVQSLRYAGCEVTLTGPAGEVQVEAAY